MSYVLDALRKSEQEREMAGRVGVSLLYPVMIEQGRRWPEPAALAMAGLMAVAMALGSWFLARHFPYGASPAPTTSTPMPIVTTTTPTPAPTTTALAPAAAMPAPTTPATTTTMLAPTAPTPAPTLPALAQREPRPVPAPKAKSATPPPPLVRETPVPAMRKHATFVTTAARTPSPGMEKNALRVEPSGSGLDLPALSIAGYVHDEQGGSLAMVNDRLVREGDEVAPGVRLEKILGDSAVFTYQGVRFRR